MLNLSGIKRGLCKAILGAAFLALVVSCSSGKVDEETFSLYINGKNYSELVRILKVYSARHGYRVTLETLQGNRPETTAQHIMVEGDGVRTLIQSALAEQCKEREGRRDVEYSQRVFDVNAFSTSYFTSKEELSNQVGQLKNALTGSGFRIVSRSESCNLL
ncbi:MAG: hypothetical protein P8Y58_09765 [Novosphingobium sp.]